MRIRIKTEYRNIIDRVNIFQLTGDARDAQRTMNENINRILRFYYYAIPELSNKDMRALQKLLFKFYKTANYYRSWQGFSDFIVPEFSVVENQDWLTIEQFIAFLHSTLFSDKLDTVDKCDLQNLIKASKLIRKAYYPNHVHTTVTNPVFEQIINKI